MNLIDILFYIVISVAVFLFAKFLWYLFKLLVFKLIIDNFIEFITEDSDEDSEVKYIKKNNSNKEDKLEKNLDKEMDLVTVERVKREQEQTEDVAVESAKANMQPRVVGVKVQVLGKFTQMVANRLGLDLKNINQDTLMNKGYHQAMLEMQRNAQGISAGRGFGKDR